MQKRGFLIFSILNILVCLILISKSNNNWISLYIIKKFINEKRSIRSRLYFSINYRLFIIFVFRDTILDFFFVRIDSAKTLVLDTSISCFSCRYYSSAYFLLKFSSQALYKSIILYYISR